MASLLEAFRKIAPQTGDAALDRARNEAARMLLHELKLLAATTSLLHALAPHDRDEAVAVVLVRLVQAGPRGEREGDPGQDKAVRGYLRVALQNAARDLLRARRSADAPASCELQSDPPAPVSGSSPEVQLDRKRAAVGLEQALCDLHEAVLPWIDRERRKDAAQRARQSAEQLLAIYRGAASVEQVLLERGAPTDPAGSRRAKLALYQQLHRAIEAMQQATDALESSGALSPERCRAVRTLVGELRLRQDDER